MMSAAAYLAAEWPVRNLGVSNLDREPGNNRSALTTKARFGFRRLQPSCFDRRQRQAKVRGNPHNARSSFLPGPKAGRPIRFLILHRQAYISGSDRSIIRPSRRRKTRQIVTFHQSTKSMAEQDKTNGLNRPHFILHIIRYHSDHMLCLISEALRHFL